MDQLLLEYRRNLIPFGHNVVGDQLFGGSSVEGRLELRKILRANQPRLVDKDVEPGLDRGPNPVDLAAVAARDNNDIARTILEHPRQRIGVGVNLELP